MLTVSFYDTKPYDRRYFSEVNKNFGFEINYFETRLRPQTVKLSDGSDVVCAFVNDDLSSAVIEALINRGVRLIAMRCAGYNNIDIRFAEGKIAIVRVPAYSPYAVAEHAIALLLTLNRHIHKAFLRTRDFNFSLNGLTGFDLHGKTVGVVGTGKIGNAFIDICRGFGMNVLAYDVIHSNNFVEYCDLDYLLKNSDIISLHCPLTQHTHHLIDESAIDKLKKGAYIINTSRGALIDSEALLSGLLSEKIGGACLDVYEEESDLFYEDNSSVIIKDEILSRLISLPNVIVTSHQGFLTEEAMNNIASTTLQNIDNFFKTGTCENQVSIKTIKI